MSSALVEPMVKMSGVAQQNREQCMGRMVTLKKQTDG